VSIPSPPVTIKVSPRPIASSVELSSLIVNVLFVSELFPILDIVLLEASIVLLVNVSVPANVAKEPSLKAELNSAVVPVTVASDKSTVIVLLALSIVLFVNVCVPVFVVNELGKVTVLDDKSKVVANLATVTALLLILSVSTALVAILPAVTAVSANWLVPIPEALTCKASPDTSIVVSSTATSKVLPVFVKASPAEI